MKKWRNESALDLYNLVLAIVLFASPWVFRLTNGTARMDFWVCSAAMVAISLGAMFAYANQDEWANALFDLWLIASPWIPGFSQARATHFAVGIGALMALLELWRCMRKPTRSRQRRRNTISRAFAEIACVPTSSLRPVSDGHGLREVCCRRSVAKP